MEILIKILRFVLLYMSLTFGAIYISDKTNKKIEKTLIINFAVIILMMYVSQLFEIMKYGVWITSILSIVGGIYTIIKNLTKEEKRQKLKNKIITPGFIFFTIIFFVLLIVLINRSLVDYDHYFYRSLITKQMFYENTVSRELTEIYPPAINLFEYFFMKVIGSYIQGIEAFAVQLLGFSMFLPFFDRKNISKFMNAIVTIIIICVPAILGNLVFYEAAYPDALLGILIGYILFTLFSENDNKFKMLSVCMALSIMSITKPIGFFLAGITIGIYLLAYLFENNCNELSELKKLFKSKEFKNICIMIITIIIVFGSWKIYGKIFTNRYGGYVRGEGESSRTAGNPIGYTIKSILTTTFGYYDDNHDAADSNNDLIPKIYNLYAMMSPIRMTFIGAIAVIMISSLVAYKHVVNKENKRTYSSYIIGITIGLALYIILLQISYLTKFSTKEMLGHNGLNRYLSTFLLAIIYFIVAVCIDNMDKKNDRKINYIILTAIIAVCTPLQTIANMSITSGIYNINSIEYTNNGRLTAMDALEKIQKEEKEEKDEIKIVSVSQKEDTNIYNYMLRYYLYPDIKTITYNEMETETIERLKKQIIEDNIKYIYIFNSNNDVNVALNNGMSLKDETLYKIEIKDEKIVLNEIK